MKITVEQKEQPKLKYFKPGDQVEVKIERGRALYIQEVINLMHLQPRLLGKTLNQGAIVTVLASTFFGDGDVIYGVEDSNGYQYLLLSNDIGAVDAGPKWEFPCFGIDGDGNIVAFESEGQGVLVKSISYDFDMFKSIENWSMICFKPFNGKITFES